MKKKILYFCLFISICIVGYFFIHSFWQSNNHFKTIYGNIETYSGEENQDFFLTYYLTNNEDVIYIDYRKNNSYVKILNLKSGEKQTILSLKEYGENIKNYSIQESIDFYNIISDTFYIQYDKKSFQTKKFDLEDNAYILFDKYSNEFFYISNQQILDKEKNTIYETEFAMNQIFLVSSSTFIATSYDNELFFIDIQQKKCVLLHSYFSAYTFDENGIYVLSKENHKINISIFNEGSFFKKISFPNFAVYSIFSKNGFLYALSKTEKGGEMRIINLKKGKISETVSITPTNDTQLNLDCLLLCNHYTVYLPTRSKEFNFNTSMYTTTQKLMRFQ